MTKVIKSSSLDDLERPTRTSL